MKMTKRERQEIKSRVEALFGGHGAHARLADGLGIARTTLLRVYTGETVDVPGYLPALVELLEALPPERWPERWR